MEDGSPAVDQFGRLSKHWAGPYGFALDFRIEHEGGAAFLRSVGIRQTEIDGVAEIVRGKTETKTSRIGARAALRGMYAALHLSTDLFGTCPERRRQSALARQRGDKSALGSLGEKAQRAIEARLAAAVWPRDHIEPAERDNEIPQRAIIGDGERGQHQDLAGRRTCVSGPTSVA